MKENNAFTKELKQNLRSSHFNMGNSEPVISSSSHSNYTKLEIP
jgi:hypothetical protein